MIRNNSYFYLEKTRSETMSAPTEQPKLTKIEEAALGGGGSETGDWVGVIGFVTSVPSGGGDEPTCWTGGGVRVEPSSGEGGGDEPSSTGEGGVDEPFSGEGGGIGVNASDECEDKGEGEGATEGEGEGGEVVWFEFLLVLSARTITNSFSFWRQLFLFPLMK